MGRYASDKGGFESPPLGNHLGICYRIIDLGTQQSQFGIAEKLMLSFELPNEKMTDGRPFVTSRILTNSLNEKSVLRAWLIAWRTRDFSPAELERFDLNNILGKPCMLSIVEKDSKRVIGSVAALPKGMSVPALHNDSFSFWIEEWDQKRFESLSDKVRAMIEKSAEYADKDHRASVATDDTVVIDDDIPF